MSNLSLFSFEGQSIRVIMLDGEPWFVAKDLCKLLEISNPSQALTRLDEDEKCVLSGDKVLSLNDDPDTTRLLAVSESGMYALVVTSRKKEVKPFRKWITSEVLPSLRKTGSYNVNPQQPAIASWYSRVMLFHQKNNIPIGYWSIFEQTINLVAKLEEFGYALPEGKILDISIGKCWAAHLRNELKINPDNVAQKYNHYYPGWAHPVEANIYPVSLLIPFQEWLQRIYKPIRLPAYFKKTDPTALPAVEKMIKALPGR